MSEDEGAVTGFPTTVYVAFPVEEARALSGVDNSPKFADWDTISTAAKRVHQAFMEQSAGDMPGWLAPVLPTEERQ